MQQMSAVTILQKHPNLKVTYSSHVQKILFMRTIVCDVATEGILFSILYASEAT